MKKFDNIRLDYAGFLAIKSQLTADLATAIESKLVAMGDDAKGVSWFSSVAHKHVREKQLRAA